MALLQRLSRSFSTNLKPSIFTGKADFYETLYFLDDVLLKIRDLKTSTPQEIEFNWLNREKMQNKLGFEMSLLEYRQIRQRLSKIQQAATVSPNIMEFLRVFGEAVRTTKSEVSSEHTAELDLKKESSLGTIDDLGRSIAIGRRKSSSAKIILVPGTGEFRVNGIPLVDYFPRPRDIYKIAKPFQVTEQFGKFNVWALVTGGGHTGNQISTLKYIYLFLFRTIWCHYLGIGKGFGGLQSRA